MSRFALPLLCSVGLLLGCSPNYQSGSTECSSDGTCPSGFICGAASGMGVTNVCYETSKTPCGSDSSSGYYCPASATCWQTPIACSTVINCGSGNYSACASEGYVADCSGSDKCRSATAGSGGSGSGGSSGTGSSSGGGGSSLGGSSGTAGASGRGGSGGSGGAGGTTGTCPAPAAGGKCNVLPACGCPTGQVCYPDTQATGLTCMTTGGLTEGADCTKKLCAAGLGCFGGVCKKYCQSDSDCTAVDTARSCEPTYWDSTNIIAGVSTCARVCDPVSPQSPRSPLLACPVGFGCYPMDSFPGASNCEPKSGTGVAGSTCKADSDCTPGFYCSKGGSCYKFCAIDADCPTGKTCNPWTTPNYAGTTSIGGCW